MRMPALTRYVCYILISVDFNKMCNECRHTGMIVFVHAWEIFTFPIYHKNRPVKFFLDP